MIARAPLTMTAAVIYTSVFCPGCSRKVMAVPGTPSIEVNRVASDSDRSGRGRVVGCKHCKHLVECIEHAA